MRHDGGDLQEGPANNESSRSKKSVSLCGLCECGPIWAPDTAARNIHTQQHWLYIYICVCVHEVYNYYVIYIIHMAGIMANIICFIT